MIIFQCDDCLAQVATELYNSPYSYSHNKKSQNSFYVPTYPFNVDGPEGWCVLYINNKVVVICPECPWEINE